MNVSPKVTAAVLAAALVTLVVYAATFVGVEIPVVAQGALTTILVAVGVSFVVGFAGIAISLLR